MIHRHSPVFVTATDTGVGKTFLTALLSLELQARGISVLAMKPFCSGSRRDVKLLQSLQPGRLRDAEMNPYYFNRAVAPWVQIKAAGGTIPLKEVLKKIEKVRSQCEVLLIEGSGGLFVPLGEGYHVGHLISRLRCRVLVVAPNRLGAINHTLLTVSGLHSLSVRDIAVVLMDQERKDLAAKTNAEVIGEWVHPVPVMKVPFLGDETWGAGVRGKNSKIIQKSLAPIVGFAIVTPVLSERKRV